MIKGDFSRWTNAAGAVIPIYNPATTRSDGRGGFLRDPFPGNLIPANQISSLSKNIAAFYPAPNVAGLVRNYVTPGTMPRKRIENAYVVKADHSFGVKNRLAFTYSKNGEYFSNAYDANPADANNWASLPYPLSGRQYYRGDQYLWKRIPVE